MDWIWRILIKNVEGLGGFLFENWLALLIGVLIGFAVMIIVQRN